MLPAPSKEPGWLITNHPDNRRRFTLCTSHLIFSSLRILFIVLLTRLTMGDWQELKNKVDEFIKVRDWGQFHNPKDIAVSISIEAAELLENFQWVRSDDVEAHLGNGKLAEVKDELADVVIYCLSMASALDVDLEATVLEKLRKNGEKYPVDKSKGSYKKYTEL